MVKTELIKRSPLRILENSMHGGLGTGNLGAVASRKGVGKTACLVHIATDKLFQGNHVIHVSFSQNTNHIISWYEDIFKEIARKRNLENAMDVHDELIKNRVVMNFNQEGISSDQIVKSLKAMISDGHFQADTIIIDGLDFTKVNEEDIKKIKNFAQEINLEIWFSVSMPPENQGLNENNIPNLIAPHSDHLSVIVYLKSDNGLIHLELVKDHDDIKVSDTHLKLDPKTLLIAEE